MFPPSPHQHADTIECPGFCGRLPSPQPMEQWQNGSGNAWDVPGTSATTEMGPFEQIFAQCKPCPWGMRATGRRSLCQPCSTPLVTYDYLFLLFHALAPFFLNSTAIGYYTGTGLRPNQRRFLWLFLQTLTALFESSLALVAALLQFTPKWQLHTVGCPKDGGLREWYSMWNNPVLDYSRTLQCSHELVYPLFSLPFTVYALNLLNLLVFRTLLYALAALSNGRRNLLPTGPFYAALWALPLLALGHAVLSGLLYALFPYMALFAALLLLVIHLSAQSSPQQQPSGRTGPGVCAMFQRVFCCFAASRKHLGTSSMAIGGAGPSLVLALLIHLALFAFALLALAIASTPNGQWSELAANRSSLLWLLPMLLPVPLLFFIFTVRLTAPNASTANRTAAAAAHR